MSRKEVRRLSTVAKGVAEALSLHPDGLQFPLLIERALADANGGHKYGEKDIRRGAIAMIRAGWIVIDRGRWMISKEGSRAHAHYTDPETFLNMAARQSIQGWLAIHTPLYLFGVTALEKLSVEYRALRRVGLRQFFGNTLSTEKWQNLLPIQAPRRWVFPQIQIRNLEELIGQLKISKAPYSEGGHAIYLPPDSLKQSLFGRLAGHYPADAGLKIIKKRGGAADTSYASGSTHWDSQIHLKLIHRPKHLSLVACLLFSEGVGPRLYDFVELQCGDQLWTAYVIEHVKGRTPMPDECKTGVGKLRELERRGLIKVLLPDGFDDPEFECPSCSNNALMNSRNNFFYVDFQNFLLTNYETYLTKIALEAAESSHFGDQNLLRGGRYLYQSIPSVNLPGKRTTVDRATVLQSLMQEANVSVSDRLVLDIGCNIGVMMAQYLKMGAAWCHGWDRRRVVPHAERVLLALGCTRFSVTGCDIADDRPLKDDMPGFLKSALDGCVISYLAIRGHVGWLKAIGHLPWSFIIYEGHEAETENEFDDHMRELRSIVDFTVVGFRFCMDGDSDQRPIAIIIRGESHT